MREREVCWRGLTRSRIEYATMNVQDERNRNGNVLELEESKRSHKREEQSVI